MDDMTALLQRARLGQQLWAACTRADRLAVVRRFRQRLAAQAAALAATVPASLQRLPGETLLAEVLPLLDACRFLERRANALLAPRRLGWRYRPCWLAGVSTVLYREPLGVVLVLGPSNYPLWLPGVQILQALVAGNAVLCKPGAGGSAALTALKGWLMEAGLDERLVILLPEEVASGTAALRAGVDHVVLTGSASTGAAVLEALAPSLVPATLELSGCDAAFVRADANLELTARALAFSMRFNGGATCIAPRRVFVAAELATALEQRLQQLVAALPSCQLAPELAARLRTVVQEACQAGGQLLAGHWDSAISCTPLLVTRATPAMRLMQEEFFAPVLALMSVRDDAEALTAAASCRYALGATVFGEMAGARALAARVRAGVVVVNDVMVPTADPRLPFGGRGRSGFGVTRGAEGLLTFTALKAVAARRGSWRPHFAPLCAADEVWIQAYITAAHGGGGWRRLQAVLALWRALLARWLASKRQEEMVG
ncbi:MAG: aldehyde dehydrogenase family protein [Candidatus Tectimicrobiota bacterium]